MEPFFEAESLWRPPTRRQIIDTYVTHLNERDNLHGQHIADSIYDSGQPLASHLVLIPVAAHQEAAQIPQALDQYAQQQTDQPFSVVLGLNSPSSEQNNPEIDKTLAAIDHTKQRHPDLDIRTAMTFYDDSTIGMIRRDLWNGALLASLDQGAYTQDKDEVIGINHDIDLVSMSPRYIQRVQRAYQHEQHKYDSAGIPPIPLPIKTTIVKHAPSPQHPNISKGTYWADFVVRQRNSSFEAGLIFPLSYYADRGGFAANAKTNEAAELAGPVDERHVIPGTIMQTSPRRYIDRLQYGFDNIWSDDTFGATNACRQVDDKPDINHATLEDIIEQDGLPDRISDMSKSAINSVVKKHNSVIYTTRGQEYAAIDTLEKSMQQAIDKKIILAMNVLARVVQSPRLASEVLSLYPNDGYRDSIIDPYFSTDD
ncbi:MAG TPA: hypothetical protein VFM68_01375 [Candidatus Saccharimonadales bacterium]|nr:hypothetical protein [Candidatus Saccharimonadales bacterium]